MQTATIQTDGSLIRSLDGNDVHLRINPAHPNEFTAPQNFGVINATVVNTLDLNATQNVLLGGGSNSNITVAPGAGIVNFSGARIQNVGTPIAGSDAVNLDYFNANNGPTTFGGDVNGTASNLQINTTNPGIGNRLITGVNSGTTTVNDPAIADNLTINGGTINNSPIGATVASSGNFTTLNSTSQSQFATTSGSVVIGTATPETADALLEISRAEADDLLVRIYNT
ncbi:MAG TPA: hypothetical protein VFH43_00725, partial [Candidatus Kapabacteria bacterium]|nr:hypothetical protein [Candidatus Kapabacteria bacterium]